MHKGHEKNVCVLCIGCPESRIDSARVQSFLRENDWNITDDINKADLILFRTCGLTEITAEESLQAIRIIKAANKGRRRANSVGLFA